jgi:membrane-associated PAP2 superfamily phosphatase
MEAAARVEPTAWPLARAALPVLGLLALAAWLQWSGADHVLAAALYDPAAGRWALDPATPLSRLLYQGERALVMAAAAAGLAVLAAGAFHAGARRWRRPVAYLLVCLAATTGLASAGKHLTNVDCPRALSDYGGHRPDVGLFGDRPDELPRARCFPAGHSSAAFSLVSLYFLAGALRPRWRGRALALGLGLGLAFGLTQWARGMHFPSHDAVSLAIAWAVAQAAAAAFRLRPGLARR